MAPSYTVLVPETGTRTVSPRFEDVPSVTPARPKFCGQCGAPWGELAPVKFCGECGAPAPSSPQSSAPTGALHPPKDLAPDMWSVAILITIRDLPDILTGKASAVQCIRGFFGIVGMAINGWLQVSILYFVNDYIVGQAVHNAQSDYAQFHREVFHENGSFNMKEWLVWKGPYMRLCNLAMSKVGFTLAVVFIWTARMLGELRSCERLARDLHHIANLPRGGSFKDMVLEKNNDDGDEDHLVHLSCIARTTIYILVVIPKFAIAVVLLLIGCSWLAATESFSDLILNALALEFIIGVDELVYDNFAPQCMQDRISTTKIVHPHKSSGADKTDAEERIWAYWKSLFYMAVCFSWAYFYLNKFQQVIPGFTHDIQEHCGGWFAKDYEPICDFSKTDPSECFPFGEQ